MAGCWRQAKRQQSNSNLTAHPRTHPCAHQIPWDLNGQVYREIYGAEMPQKLAPPRHPRFRFANAVCVVTNLPELLRGGFSESEPQKWSVEPFDVNIPPEMSD